MEGLTQGRIVHYVANDYQEWPAIITRVWEPGTGMSNLYVFLGDGNEARPVTSVANNEAKIPNSWHWIERT